MLVRMYDVYAEREVVDAVSQWYRRGDRRPGPSTTGVDDAGLHHGLGQ